MTQSCPCSCIGGRISCPDGNPSLQKQMSVGWSPDLPLLVAEGRESLHDDSLDVILSGRESTMRMSNVSRDICVEPDHLPVVAPKLAVVPLAIPVVAQTRPRVDWGLDLPLPMDEGRESLHDDAVDVIFSERASTVRLSDVSRDICVTPDHLPDVVSKEAV